MAYQYVAGRSSFDDLFAVAVEEIPVLPAASVGGELAALVVTVESEYAAGEYSAATAFVRIAAFVARSPDKTIVESDLRVQSSWDDTAFSNIILGSQTWGLEVAQGQAPGTTPAEAYV